MILRRGITSFFDCDDLVSIPKFGNAEFKRIVYAAVAPMEYTVSNVTKRGITPNFHSAMLSSDENVVSILGHSNYPIFAFTEPLGSNSRNVRFIDCEPLSQQIVTLFPNATVATTAELTQPLSNAHLNKLDAVELKQIKYWKPKTVGDVAFNWWD